MVKTHIPTKNSKTNGQHKNSTKNFDYTTIADRLRTVSWSNNSHPTGVVNESTEYFVTASTSDDRQSSVFKSSNIIIFGASQAWNAPFLFEYLSLALFHSPRNKLTIATTHIYILYKLCFSWISWLLSSSCLDSDKLSAVYDIPR